MQGAVSAEKELARVIFGGVNILFLFRRARMTIVSVGASKLFEACSY